MASLEEIRTARLAKLKKLTDAGYNPYPAIVAKDLTLKEAKAGFEALEKTGAPKALAGRVTALRGQGAIMFAVLDDGTGTFQAVFKKDDLPEVVFSLFIDTVDLGDIISVTGKFFTTQRGEPSLLVSNWQIAAKSLLPLPEKWHGLQDTEERLRKRYLDFATNKELRELFYQKAKFWQTTRRLLQEAGFLEVETPTLELTTGGAEARPFSTHHHDYDLDVFLRISVGELWQKRLMAGAFPRTFEIGRAYRNEGSSPEHLQEFTNLEFYASYLSFDEGVKFSENLIKQVVQETFGTLNFSDRENGFDLSLEWPRIDYAQKISELTGIDVFKASEAKMKAKLNELKVKFEGDNRERLTDTLWKYCRKQIRGPAWLVNHPKLVSPLAKANPENPETTLRVQLLLNGAEMSNGFAELNDPLDQRSRFEEQAKLLAEGDKEAMMADWEFVEMLEHGMPPVFGQCFGERLFATLANKPIRETQLFPLVRPKE